MITEVKVQNQLFLKFYCLILKYYYKLTNKLLHINKINSLW
jgi:hypothetical protein